MGRQSHKAIERILKIGSMTHDEAIKFMQSEKKPALRWKLMDVAYGDNIRNPRRLVLEVNPEYPSHCYTTCSEHDGIGSHSDYSLRTREEWLAWVDRFSDDLTGRELREAKEAVRADFVEPQSWTDFRKRFAETGDPWIRETNTPNNQAERRRAMKKADTNDSSPAPFAPATGSSGPCPICRDPGCMGNECSPPPSEEDDDAMEEWLSELTETCQADLRAWCAAQGLEASND